jgi:CTP-dependent riboflavin kinase
MSRYLGCANVIYWYELETMILKGQVVRGVGHFRGRMTTFADVFERYTGEKLFAGTLNVDVGRAIPVREDFRIPGKEIGEPHQDLIFEHCRINGTDAFRIRPCDANGNGGHGDHILEIASAKQLSNVEEGTTVNLEFSRESD